MKLDILGVQVDNITNQETIAKIDELVQGGNHNYIVTPYSEMIVFAERDEKYKQALNNAALSLPDGIGILWAAKYLQSPKYKLLTTLTAIIFDPGYIRSVIKEQVTGSHLIWDIAKLAAEKNYSIALVGGENGVAEKTAEKLKIINDKLEINLAVSDGAFDSALVDKINQSKSDILLIGYSPPKQELWLAENIANLGAKVAIGLGGTFDYIAGKHPTAPRFLHYIGLEWLWRLITQPWRIKRIWNAVPVFVWKVYKYKLKNPSGRQIL